MAIFDEVKLDKSRTQNEKPPTFRLCKVIERDRCKQNLVNTYLLKWRLGLSNDGKLQTSFLSMLTLEQILKFNSKSLLFGRHLLDKSL